MRALCAIALLLLMAGATDTAVAAVDPHAPVSFDIPVGDAATTLNTFSTQSKLQLLYGYESMRGVQTSAVRGEMKPFDALDRMIAGTDIRYEFVNRRTVTLSRGAAPDPNATRRALRSGRRTQDRRTSDARVEEVLISSSHASAAPVPGSAQFNLTRKEIESTGQVSVQSIVRTLPQVFGGGPTEDTQQNGSEAQTNTARGYGINLRGLGASATLVLMNGRRLAPGGSEGLFVDVSNLPVAAIERLEILPDSASTFYGTDSAAGVVNFVMRERFDGCQTEAHYGAATRGRLTENYVSQLCGAQNDKAHGLIALDFYSRDHLSAGSRAQARSDLTAFGGSNFDMQQSNPGNILFGAQSWAIPRGQDGTKLTFADFKAGTRNLQNRYESVDILPSQQRLTVFGTGRLELSESVALFGDVLLGERTMRGLGGGQIITILVPEVNPYYINPIGLPGPVTVSYNLIDDLGAQVSSARVNSTNVLAGLELRLPSEWTVTATAGYAAERIRMTNTNQVSRMALDVALNTADPAQALNVFGDGSHTNRNVLDALRATSLFTTHSTLASGGIMVAGPIAKIDDRDIVMTVGAEARQQSFESISDATTVLPQPILSIDRSRWIRSGFADLKIPLISSPDRVPGIRSLEISLAGRYERHDDFGQTLAARYGLAWSASRALTLRGTYSESFRPPGLLDLDESANFHQFVPLPDPETELGRSNTLLWIGKNRELREENARTWTIGLDFTPVALPDAALALTYFNTRFVNRQSEPLPTTDMLSDPAMSTLITRNPTVGDLNEVCSRAPQSSGFNACRVPDLQIDAIVDLRTRNDAVMETSGLDLLARYSGDTRFGRWSFGLNGTYTFEFSEARAPRFPMRNMVSTPTYPINLKLLGTVGWQRGATDVSASASYVNSYSDTLSSPPRHVSSWTTLDLQFRYSTQKMSLSLGASNLLDTDPPFLNNAVGIGYDQENGDLTGRVVRLTLRKKW